MDPDYISFFDAKKILSANLGKTPSNEEFWLWCFFGRNSGHGIGAYEFDEAHKKVHVFQEWHEVSGLELTELGSSLSKRARMAEHWCFFGRTSGYGVGAYVFEDANKKMPDKEVFQLFRGWYPVSVVGWSDWGTSLSNRARQLNKWFFLRADIEAFEAKDRYLTSNELVRRWATMDGSEEGAIQIIEDWYRQEDTWCPRNEGNRLPSLQNLYFGAISITQQVLNEAEMRDIKLGGIFSIGDVLAVEEYIGMKEPQAEAVADAGAVGGAVKPREGGYKLRDEFAIRQVELQPKLLDKRPGDIKTNLQAASKLFASGYDAWWRKNPIFAKGAAGRNPK